MYVDQDGGQHQGEPSSASADGLRGHGTRGVAGVLTGASKQGSSLCVSLHHCLLASCAIGLRIKQHGKDRLRFNGCQVCVNDILRTTYLDSCTKIYFCQVFMQSLMSCETMRFWWKFASSDA